MDKVIVPFGFVSFTIEKFVVGTFQEVSGCLQGLGVAVDVSTGARVGEGSSVKVKIGMGVFVEVLVAVGIVVWVSGMDVVGSAVFWFSWLLKVGGFADVPQALIKTTNSMV
ncbi:MAG: hypothetical protein ABI904_11850 [Chloroflexota bacterium]